MEVLDDVEWDAVRRHYDERVVVHQRLLRLAEGKLVKPFFRLALGIDDPAGNYSAAEWSIGPKVAASNARPEERIFELAGKFRALASGRTVPALVRQADLRHVAIGVGSELSCMVNPRACWVANTRTIWTHLVWEHKGSIATVDEALALYRDGETEGAMAYKIWETIHGLLENSMRRIAAEGAERARQARVEPGAIEYLWADAVANYLYAAHH